MNVYPLNWATSLLIHLLDYYPESFRGDSVTTTKSRSHVVSFHESVEVFLFLNRYHFIRWGSEPLHTRIAGRLFSLIRHVYFSFPLRTSPPRGGDNFSRAYA